MARGKHCSPFRLAALATIACQSSPQTLLTVSARYARRHCVFYPIANIAQRFGSLRSPKMRAITFRKHWSPFRPITLPTAKAHAHAIVPQALRQRARRRPLARTMRRAILICFPMARASRVLSRARARDVRKRGLWRSRAAECAQEHHGMDACKSNKPSAHATRQRAAERLAIRQRVAWWEKSLLNPRGVTIVCAPRRVIIHVL